MMYTKVTMTTGNSTLNYVRLTVRVDKEVAQRLKSMAAKQNRSLSSLLRDAISGVLMFEEHPEVMDFLKSIPDMLQLGIESLAVSNNQSNVTNPIAELFQPSLQPSHHPKSTDIDASSNRHELAGDSGKSPCPL
ncbi:CopG family transcriptional regulator [Candidatus Bipolaricaulota bacterium]|nr:CopG family transcriptional regulator [Candidatus Bipolaricaulota bacterium]